MTHTRRSLMALIAAGALLAGHAWALDAPKGKVILTVSGKVGESNGGGKAAFDLAMLEQLPQQTFSTNTPWDSKPTVFKGPLLRDVLKAAKASGTTLIAAALNDYKVTIPADDAQAHDVILAHKMNGENIPVRTKGPLFVVYPYDSKPELKDAKFIDRSIWQLKSIEVQ